MTYVIIVLETGSDTPGIDAVFGPFETRENADAERERAKRLTLADPDLIQVARVETIREPL